MFFTGKNAQHYLLRTYTRVAYLNSRTEMYTRLQKSYNKSNKSAMYFQKYLKIIIFFSLLVFEMFMFMKIKGLL